VVLGTARPRDRSEQELAGYRKALDWIFSRKRPVPLSLALILRLHKLAQGRASGDAGQWKQRDNEIIELLPNGEHKIRFKPTAAKQTSKMMKQLCDHYLHAGDSHKLPPLLVISTCVFDFLCIHPFRDGNGRVSRLLTTHLLQQNGFEVGRYVSLERLIEDSKAEYYQVLAHCSQNWHKGKNEIIPWWNYFLGIVHRAYQDFAQQIEQTHSRPAKTDLIRRAILDQVGPFTLADMTAQLPFASTQLVKKVLTQLKQAGIIRLVGRGRGARWEVI
jgi:Fic family protein